MQAARHCHVKSSDSDRVIGVGCQDATHPFARLRFPPDIIRHAVALCPVHFVSITKVYTPPFYQGNSPIWGLSRNGVKNYSKGPCVTILE